MNGYVGGGVGEDAIGCCHCSVNAPLLCAAYVRAYLSFFHFDNTNTSMANYVYQHHSNYATS